MTEQGRATRQIERIKDAEGRTCSFVVLVTLPDGRKLNPKIVYPMHIRYSELEEAKAKEEAAEVDIQS